MLTTKQIETYLSRIKYTGHTSPTIQTLFALHTKHTFTIPFENFDVMLQRPISLDVKDLYQKIIVNQRGGYCFELNGLFSALLTSLGFDVCNHLARVYSEPTFSKLHHTIVVNIKDKQWLADVGFGGNGLIAPLLLEKDYEDEQYSDLFRMSSSNDGYILQHKHCDTWNSLYVFNREACLPQDFVVSNYYTSTSPNSPFTKKRMCTKPTTSGRISLVNSQFSVREYGKTTIKKDINNTMEYKNILAEQFGLIIPDIDLQPS